MGLWPGVPPGAMRIRHGRASLPSHSRSSRPGRSRASGGGECGFTRKSAILIHGQVSLPPSGRQGIPSYHSYCLFHILGREELPCGRAESDVPPFQRCCRK